MYNCNSVAMDRISSYEFMRIAEYIEEDDVKFLYMTGCKFMQNLLAKSVTTVTKLDPMYDSFVNIRTLKRVILDEDTILPPSITHIGVIVTDMEPTDVARKLPPNITRLTLMDWSESDLFLLPKTMRQLKLVISECDYNTLTLPAPEKGELWLDVLELELPACVETLIIHGVPAVEFIRKSNDPLHVYSNIVFKYTNLTQCNAILYSGSEHLVLSEYHPVYNGDDPLSIIKKCDTLISGKCNIPHTFAFPPTMTTVNLGLVNWYVTSLLPATVTSVSAKIRNGDPPYNDVSAMCNMHRAATSANVSNMISFPPNLRKLTLELGSPFPASTFHCDVDVLPSTLTHLEFSMVSGRNKENIVQRVIDQIPLCLNLEMVAVIGGDFEPKSECDLSRLSKLAFLHAPICVDVGNLPRSIRNLNCFALRSTDDNDIKCRLLNVKSKLISSQAYATLLVLGATVQYDMIFDGIDHNKAVELAHILDKE